MRTRAELETIEAQTLAPWAQKSADSAGRAHAEPLHTLRTCYQRDRARVAHSRAFRRLEYKTQVFRNGTSDHFRTRLTHTVEVAQISRSIARSLGLNEDLAETIALAHDLGHPPFGHSGEETMDELMRGHGGFEHNGQSLRVVEVLETKYPTFPGLNLTWEVREGLQKHARFYETPVGGETRPSPSLEAQLTNLADEITYYSHDLDDGLDSGLLTPRQLGQLEIWEKMHRRVRDEFPDMEGEDLLRYTVRCLTDLMVEDVVRTSTAAIASAGVQSADDVRRHHGALIRYSDDLLAQNRELRRFLYANLYFHPAVAARNQRACGWLREVFHAYLADPARLGRYATARLQTDGLHRTVCDYIAGMTDRYLIEEHQRLTGISESL